MFERRIRRISQLREVCLQMRRALLTEAQAGRINFTPQMDIRSDYEYWRKKLEEKEKSERESK